MRSRPFVALLLLALLLAPAASPAQAPAVEVMTVHVNAGELLRLDRPAAKVFIADPEVADFQAASASSILVFGRRSGRTNLYALDERDRLVVSRTVVVEHDVAAIRDMLRAELPDAAISVRSTPGGVVLSGMLASSRAVDHAVRLASGFLATGESIVNQLQVTSPTQVNIRIRVAEMSREVSRRFGFNWDAAFNLGKLTVGLLTGRAPIGAAGAIVPHADIVGAAGGALAGTYSNAGTDVTGLIDALAAESLISILAEPNLTAVSGETASFIAGGEFPIPISRDRDTVTIEFKRFGVVLDITPTVLSPNRISLRVRPEVSNLSDEGAITMNDIRIPAISVSRTETTIELASGQSFAIAGLMHNRTRTGLSKFPGLGDIPVLGVLFRSEQFQRQETELVVIATAYLVEPTSGTDRPSPLTGFRPVTEIERIFQGKVARTAREAGQANPLGPAGARLAGDAGFFF
jgi:pilus assembly protein CpaC